MYELSLKGQQISSCSVHIIKCSRQNNSFVNYNDVIIYVMLALPSNCCIRERPGNPILLIKYYIDYPRIVGNCTND